MIDLEVHLLKMDLLNGYHIIVFFVNTPKGLDYEILSEVGIEKQIALF